MKTREDLQAWARAGCPVPVEPEEPQKRDAFCDLFYLTVQPGPGRLLTECSTCRIKHHCGAIKADKEWTGGVADACETVSSWMVEHACRSGLSRPQAVEAFLDVPWQHVANWIKSAMRGTGGGPYSGLIMPKGVDPDLERGIWLVDARMPVGP